MPDTTTPMTKRVLTDHVTEGDREDAAGLVVFHRTHVVQNVATRLILHILVISQQHPSLLLTASTHA